MMLSGVTLITHGFQLDAVYPEWVDSMALEVAGHIARSSGMSWTDVSIYRLTTTHDLQGNLSVESFVKLSGPTPNQSESGEIVITLDWSDEASLNPLLPTSDIASHVASALLDPTAVPGLGGAMAQLPIHLIGHSRGGSLVASLAEQLGELGIWIDQVTYLDPHPISEDYGSSFPDNNMPAPTTNVIFADNYYQLWDIIGGRNVPGAYQGFYTALPLVDGYFSNHSDIHLWYHGTIDTSILAHNGDVPVPSTWYASTRDTNGFYYSRIGGGGRPASGVGELFGGTGVRTPITLNQAALQWPNVANVRIADSRTTFTIGESLPIHFSYQDTDSSARVDFYLDTDQNPYNGMYAWGGAAFLPSTDIPTGSSFTVATGGDPGQYYLVAKIDDGALGNRVRYSYAPSSITLREQEILPGNDVSIAAMEWFDHGGRGNGNGVIEGGERPELNIHLTAPTRVDNLQARIITGDAGVDIIRDEQWYGTILAGTTLDYSFSMRLNFDTGRTSQFFLLLEYERNGQPYYQNLTFSKQFYGPGELNAVFQITGSTIIDSPQKSGTNNGDGIFQSSERIEVFPQITNSGSALATDLIVRLIPTNPVVSELYGSSGDANNYSRLEPGQTVNNRGWNIRLNDLSFTGPLYFDVEVQWAQGGQTLVISNGLVLNVQPAPVLRVTPTVTAFGTKAPGDPITTTLRVENVGSALLTVTDILTSHGDVIIAPADRSFTLAAGVFRDITVTIDTSAIPNGTQLERYVDIVSDGRVSVHGKHDRLVISGLISAEVPVYHVPNAQLSSGVDVSGTWVVWTDNRDGNSEIYAFNIMTGEERRITNNPASQGSVRIDQGLIVWNDYRNSAPGQAPNEIRGYDLSTGTELIIASGVDEKRVIGVWNGIVAYIQVYQTWTGDWDRASNLWLYNTVTDVATNVTGYMPASGTTSRNSVRNADFGGGTLAWNEHTIYWRTDGSYWDSKDTLVKKMQIGQDTNPIQVLAGPYYVQSADAGRFAWSQSYQGGSGTQIFVWPDWASAPLTTDDRYHGDQALAIGGNYVIYDKSGIDGLFYRDLRSPANEYRLTATRNAWWPRIEGNVVVWEQQVPGQGWGVYYALLEQPDIAVFDADLSHPESLTEGQAFQVNAVVRNVSQFGQASDITVALYYEENGDEVLMGQQVISGGLAAQGVANVVFEDLAAPSVAAGDVVGYSFVVRLSFVSFDNPDNNVVAFEIPVRSLVSDGPQILDFMAEAVGGRQPGTIGSDEMITLSWWTDDPRGTTETHVQIGALVVEASLMETVIGDVGVSQRWQAQVSPMAAGSYDLTIIATGDGAIDRRSETSAFMEVALSPRLIVLYRGTVAAAWDQPHSLVEVGMVPTGATENLINFAIKNVGGQSFQLGTVVVPDGFHVVSAPSNISTFGTLILEFDTAQSASYDGMVVVYDDNGSPLASFNLSVMVQDPSRTEVLGRHVFYNNSAFDGNSVAANASDDGALAADKSALLPGQAATFANYTSYSRGLNGMMIDVSGLGSDTLTSEDFVFRVGTSGDPSTWTSGPAPVSVTVREGAGVDGSDRVTVIWADGAILKQWLQVTMLSNERTGLEVDDVFYFGNAVGEVGNTAGDTRVNATDISGAWSNLRGISNPAPIDFRFDVNRDGRVNATDISAMWSNLAGTSTSLQLIETPEVSPDGALMSLQMTPQPLWLGGEVSEVMEDDLSEPQTEPAPADMSSRLSWLWTSGKLQVREVDPPEVGSNRIVSEVLEGPYRRRITVQPLDRDVWDGGVRRFL